MSFGGSSSTTSSGTILAASCTSDAVVCCCDGKMDYEEIQNIVGLKCLYFDPENRTHFLMYTGLPNVALQCYKYVRDLKSVSKMDTWTTEDYAEETFHAIHKYKADCMCIVVGIDGGKPSLYEVYSHGYMKKKEALLGGGAKVVRENMTFQACNDLNKTKTMVIQAVKIAMEKSPGCGPPAYYTCLHDGNVEGPRAVTKEELKG